jgi:hypothetical protein
MLRLVSAAAAVAFAASQAGQAECDAGSKCSFTTTYKGEAAWRLGAAGARGRRTSPQRSNAPSPRPAAPRRQDGVV